MTRFLLPLLLLSACGPTAERTDLLGLWGRVNDGVYEIWEFAEAIDATGLTEVRPAFRTWGYPTDDVPQTVRAGRWDVISGDLILTPTWSLTDGEANRTVIWGIDDFDPRELQLLPPDVEEPVTYTILDRLPEPAPEE